jgi:DNA-binding XRE family transcriptional regulator
MTETHKTTDAIEILRRRFFADDPDFESEVAAEIENCRISRQVYDLRKEAGLSQEALADLVGTSRSVIARLEAADYEGHSMAMLRRIAEALHKRVEVRFLPVESPLNAPPSEHRPEIR